MEKAFCHKGLLKISIVIIFRKFRLASLLTIRGANIQKLSFYKQP
jgi:hypothetical protein